MADIGGNGTSEAKLSRIDERTENIERLVAGLRDDWKIGHADHETRLRAVERDAQDLKTQSNTRTAFQTVYSTVLMAIAAFLGSRQ